MSVGSWLKKGLDVVIDKALGPAVGFLLSSALFVGLRQRLFEPVPLWVGIAGLTLGALVGYGLSGWRNRKKARHPTDTIRVFPRRSDWQFGYVDQRAFRTAKPTSTLFHFRFEVTNITDVPVRLVDAELALGFLHTHAEGWVHTREADGNLYSSRHYIEPGHTTEASADFVVTPPPWSTRRSRDLVAAVRVRDQWNNVYKVRKVTFATSVPRVKDTPERPTEQLHAIQDPIEKGVAAILKAELARYRDAGARSRGLLGSVKSKGQDGRGQQPGIGTEWRSVDSADQQSLVHGIPSPAITSDNAEALVVLHGHQETDADRERYIEALLRRLDRSTEYADVGYLIALAGFRIGRLDRVLIAAKAQLRGDDAFGFSDVLRIVDALLRLEHTAFSEPLLDAVERFLENLPKEETLRMRERIAEIRAHRVRVAAEIGPAQPA